MDRPQICRHLRGGPVSAPYVLMVLNRIASKAGIKNRNYPHGLHHTHALELASEATPIKGAAPQRNQIKVWFRQEIEHVIGGHDNPPTFVECGYNTSTT